VEGMKFLVNINADKLPLCKRYLFHDLNSHGCTARHYGLPRVALHRATISWSSFGDWREAEWPEDAAEPTVRSMDGDEPIWLRCVIMGDFSTRDAALEFAAERFPAVAEQMGQPGSVP
jgi:hypothetical protein